MVGYLLPLSQTSDPWNTLFPSTSDLGTYFPPTDIRPGDLPLLLLLTTNGHHWRHVQTYSLEYLLPAPLVLTSSSGHRNMYHWQAAGMHPTGMLSCFSSYHPTIDDRTPEKFMINFKFSTITHPIGGC